MHPINIIVIIALILLAAIGVEYLMMCTGEKVCHGAWQDIQATRTAKQTAQPQIDWQWFATNQVCDGRQGQVGWNNTSVQCTHDWKNGWHYHYYRDGKWTH